MGLSSIDMIITQKVLNDNTGELEAKDFKQIKSKKNIRGGFNMIYHKVYEDVMEEVINSKKELKLFNWITNKFTYQKVETPLPFSEVSFISKRQFSEMIRKLVELKYIKRISKGVYRLNPFIYLPYKSDAQELQKQWKEEEFYTKPK